MCSPKSYLTNHWCCLKIIKIGYFSIFLKWDQGCHHHPLHPMSQLFRKNNININYHSRINNNSSNSKHIFQFQYLRLHLTLLLMVAMSLKVSYLILFIIYNVLWFIGKQLCIVYDNFLSNCANTWYVYN